MSLKIEIKLDLLDWEYLEQSLDMLKLYTRLDRDVEMKDIESVNRITDDVLKQIKKGKRLNKVTT